MTPTTIYLVTNKISGTQYVGFTSKPLSERIKTHKSRMNCGVKNKLYESIKSYGWDNFNWNVIYQSWDADHCLNIMEPYFIEQYNTLKNGYNMTKGGEGTLGYWNEETKKIQSDFIKNTWTPERKIKNGILAKEKMTGVPKTKNHKNNMKGFRPHINQTGERNNNPKPIITPYGKFGSIKTAEKELKEKGINLSYKQIWYRLNKQNDWNYTL